MPHVPTRSMLISIAAAMALIAGGTAAGAAIAGPIDGSGVIHGCWTNAAFNGTHVFVLQDAGTTCPRATTAISWNQQGPAGPVGPAGPAGPAGVTHAWTATSASVGSSSFILGASIVEVDNLPPGNYVAWVTGETDLTALGENFAQCFLESDSGLIQQQNEQLGPPDRGTSALTGATSLPNGGTIILRCGTQITTGLLPINFVHNSLTVIQVDAIN
jgi:hypothetical protein